MTRRSADGAHPRSRGEKLPVVVGALGFAALVVAVGLSSSPRFSGPRWVPSARPAPPASPGPQASLRPIPSATPRPVTPPGPGLDIYPIALVVVGIAVLVLGVLAARLILRHRRSPLAERPIEAPATATAAPTSDSPSAPVLRRAFAGALEALHSERPPGDAVVTAWLALQDAAAESGVKRRAAETPAEFTARILARVPADRHAIHALLDVYQGVRFGQRIPTAHDVDRVRAALDVLAASWDDTVDATTDRGLRG